MSREFSVQLKNPTALYYFNQVARAGSFRKAAEITHIAASAINRQVKNLEDELEAPLFERGRGRTGLVLTAAGEILLHHIGAVSSELIAAKHQIDALRGLRRGNVRMGVNEGFAKELLRDTIGAFHHLYPDVTFEILVAATPRLDEMVLADEIELAVGYNAAPRAALHVVARCSVGSCIMVPRDHPLASKSSVRLLDCAPYDVVMPHSNLALRLIIDRMFETVRVKPRIVLTTDSYEMMRFAASAGIGIAFVTNYLKGLDPSFPNCAFIPVRGNKACQHVVSCYVRRGRQLSVTSATLIEDLKAILSKRSEELP